MVNFMNGTCERINALNMHQIIETVLLIHYSLAVLNFTAIEIDAIDSFAD